MVKNSSFEELKDGTPRNWRIVQRGLTGSTHRVETAPVCDGKNAVSLENRENTEGGVLIWGQTLPTKEFRAVPPGTLMELRAKVQAADSPARAKIYFESVAARKTIVRRKLIVPGKWEDIFLQFKKEAID